MEVYNEARENGLQGRSRGVGRLKVGGAFRMTTVKTHQMWCIGNQEVANPDFK